MSRCFPFTRADHGMEDRGKGQQPLLESTKKGREKAANDSKKQKKREKKERREKQRDGKESKSKKRKHDEMSRLKQEDEGRHTEIKSGLTEENGPPISAPNPCASSDSTQDSGKRRKLTPVDAGNNNRAGFVFRIKLPQKKHIDVAPPAIDERPCSSGQIEKSKALLKPKNLDSLAANKQTLLTDRRLDQPRVEKSQTLLSNPKKPDSLAANKQTLLTDRPSDQPRVEKTQTLPKPKNLDSLAAHKRTLITDRPLDQPRVEKPQTLPKPKKPDSLVAHKRTLLTDRPLDRVEKPRTLPKPKNPDSLLANERTLLTVQPLDQPLLLKHTTPDPEPPATTREQPCTSGRALQPEAAAEADRKKRSKSKSRSRGDERENHYRELVLNWLPPLQLENQDDEDQDWLFGTKPKTGDFITERCDEVLDHGGDVSKARYLPELDMVMLPYVVPY